MPDRIPALHVLQVECHRGLPPTAGASPNGAADSNSILTDLIGICNAVALLPSPTSLGGRGGAASSALYQYDESRLLRFIRMSSVSNNILRGREASGWHRFETPHL